MFRQKRRGSGTWSGLGSFSVVDYLVSPPNDPIMNLVSLAELISPSPPRCPLNPTILSDVDCGAYVRQTVEYAVEEAERWTRVTGP